MRQMLASWNKRSTGGDPGRFQRDEDTPEETDPFLYRNKQVGEKTTNEGN